MTQGWAYPGNTVGKQGKIIDNAVQSGILYLSSRSLDLFQAGGYMIRTKNEAIARAKAVEINSSYGLSIFDGFYYVGNESNLMMVGVAQIINPRNSK